MGSLVCLVPSEQSTRAGWQAGRTHSLEDSPTIKFMGTKADLVKTLRRGGGGGGGWGHANPLSHVLLSAEQVGRRRSWSIAHEEKPQLRIPGL